MKTFLATLAAILVGTGPALAEGIEIEDAYVLVSRPGAPSGAIFMVIRNAGDAADRLLDVNTEIAARAELHTHIEEDGIMKMRPIEGGIGIEARSSHALERGGDHVMLMGLTETLEDGMEVDLTLTFEKAGEVETKVVVNNRRGQAGHGG